MLIIISIRGVNWGAETLCLTCLSALLCVSLAPLYYSGFSNPSVAVCSSSLFLALAATCCTLFPRNEAIKEVLQRLLGRLVVHGPRVMLDVCVRRWWTKSRKSFIESEGWASNIILSKYWARLIVILAADAELFLACTPSAVPMTVWVPDSRCPVQ